MGGPKQLEPPKKEESYLKYLKPIKTAVKTALLIPLVPVALLSGCSADAIGAKEPEKDAGAERVEDAGIETVEDAGGVDADAGETDTEIQENLEWRPGYLAVGDEIQHVSLAFRKDQTYLCQIEHCYASEDEILQSERDAGMPIVRAVMKYSGFFFKEDAFADIAGNNVITIYPPDWGASGGFDDEAFGLRITEEGGKLIANCFEGCPEYQQVSVKEGGEVVIFHELLHDAWHTYLTEEERQDFAGDAKAFFNALGDDKSSDKTINAIWEADYLRGPELDEWAETALPGMSDMEKEGIKDAVKSYMEIHGTIVHPRTKDFTPEQRESFIVFEGFAYMGARYPVLNELRPYYESGQSGNTRFIPAFMRKAYEPLIKKELLDSMVNNGGGSFSTRKDFDGLVKHLESFRDWMTERHPEILAE